MWILIDIDNSQYLGLRLCYTDEQFKNVPEEKKKYYKKL